MVDRTRRLRFATGGRNCPQQRSFSCSNGSAPRDRNNPGAGLTYVNFCRRAGLSTQDRPLVTQCRGRPKASKPAVRQAPSPIPAVSASFGQRPSFGCQCFRWSKSLCETELISTRYWAAQSSERSAKGCKRHLVTAPNCRPASDVRSIGSVNLTGKRQQPFPIFQATGSGSANQRRRGGCSLQYAGQPVGGPAADERALSNKSAFGGGQLVCRPLVRPRTRETRPKSVGGNVGSPPPLRFPTISEDELRFAMTYGADGRERTAPDRPLRQRLDASNPYAKALRRAIVSAHFNAYAAWF
jgi:hypothetical protein